jgi:release factor glutamine methyltransferase
MRVGGNGAAQMLQHYRRELEGLYEESEIRRLFEICTEHYTGIKAQGLYSRPVRFNQSDLIRIYDACKALKSGAPVQYVTGEEWFYGLRFAVDPAVLIPRPETEELVDIILKENMHPRAALDIGTGSGCIAVTLKKKRRECSVTAVDVSRDALRVASSNALSNKADVTFLHLDVFDASFAGKAGTFDLVVSNPPYIADDPWSSTGGSSACAAICFQKAAGCISS